MTQVMEWQPIATAPGEDHEVLLCGRYASGARYLTVGSCDDYGVWTDLCGEVLHDLTHWMPYPDPPRD